MRILEIQVFPPDQVGPGLIISAMSVLIGLRSLGWQEVEIIQEIVRVFQIGLCFKIHSVISVFVFVPSDYLCSLLCSSFSNLSHILVLSSSIFHS